MVSQEVAENRRQGDVTAVLETMQDLDQRAVAVAVVEGAGAGALVVRHVLQAATTAMVRSGARKTLATGRAQWRARRRDRGHAVRAQRNAVDSLLAARAARREDEVQRPLDRPTHRPMLARPAGGGKKRQGPRGLCTPHPRHRTHEGW